ncbi:hypothetical protein V8F33_005248 [Rhypophila sp. PSN 637]
MAQTCTLLVAPHAWDRRLLYPTTPTKEPRAFTQRLHLLISRFLQTSDLRRPECGTQHPDPSQLIEVALETPLPGVRRKCSEGALGNPPPGFTEAYIKYSIAAIEYLSKECTSCLVLWVQSMLFLFLYLGLAAPTERTIGLATCSSFKQFTRRKCCLSADLPPPDSVTPLPTSTESRTLLSENTPDLPPELDVHQPSPRGASLEPLPPRHPSPKRPTDYPRIPEQSKFHRVSSPSRIDRAVDLPASILSTSTSIDNNPANRADFLNHYVNPFTTNLSDQDLAAEIWMGFSYTMSEIFEHGTKVDPTILNIQGSHFEINFEQTGLRLFYKDRSLTLRGGGSVQWPTLEPEIRQGVNENEWITSFLLKPNSQGRGTMLVAKCGNLGILFTKLTLWQLLRNQYHRQPRQIGVLKESQLKFAGKSFVF